MECSSSDPPHLGPNLGKYRQKSTNKKSIITKNNINIYAKRIKVIAKIFGKFGVKVALETNVDVKLIRHLLKLIKKKNVFIVYDTGNRLKKGNLSLSVLKISFMLYL